MIILSTKEARNKAIQKYDKAHYKSLACKIKLSDLDTIKAYAERQKINSNSKLLYKCLMYCIDNEIKL